jgi:hypothetical protein
MAVLEPGRDRAAASLQGAELSGRAVRVSRQRSRAWVAVETFFVLMVIALGVLALRFVLVLAHGAFA